MGRSSGDRIRLVADDGITPVNPATSTIQTDGTQKAIVRGGAKGSTTAADITSTTQSADRQGLDVQIRTSAGVAVDTFGGGTQYAELATTSPATGTGAIARYKVTPPVLTDGQLYIQQLDASGNLKVNVAAGGTSGQQYADGVARGTATGTLLMVDDGTNIQSALGTTAGVLKVDLSATTANATAVKVDGSAVTQPISAVALPLPTGAALESTQSSGNTLLGAVTETAPASDTASSGLNGRLQRIAQRITSLIALFPTALGQGTMATSMKVVLPSDQSAIPIKNVSATAALTNVASSATNVTLIASNANRIGLIIYNDSTAILSVKFGAVASATSFTTKIGAAAAYEVDLPVYTGLIDGIWAAANGSARITELT